MIENIAFALTVSFWALAAIVVFLRLAFPRAPLTGKFIEYSANVTVSHKETVTTRNHHSAYHRAS
jgi:hypothetical protein